MQDYHYSATITNELVQTLADGNHIAAVGVPRATHGADAAGNGAATDGEFIGCECATIGVHPRYGCADVVHAELDGQDGAENSDVFVRHLATGPGVMGGGATTTFVRVDGGVTAGTAPLPPLPPPMVAQATLIANDQAEASTEDLGSKTMEGIIVNGVRTTRTIPSGEIGNEKPISIVTEVWTSPDLKTVVYSKRSDPRMGEQTFQLTNIVRAEPDASLFQGSGGLQGCGRTAADSLSAETVEHQRSVFSRPATGSVRANAAVLRLPRRWTCPCGTTCTDSESCTGRSSPG